MQESLFDDAARRILAEQSASLPDLGQVTVLLPNYHAAQHLLAAIAAHSGHPVLIPPRMSTLSDWADEVVLDEAVASDNQRLSLLYQALRARRDWFGETELWGLAHEMLGLLDELTEQHIRLPADVDEFTAQIESIWQLSSAPLRFEARLVHDLWRAMNVSGALDQPLARQRRLARQAKSASAPLYVLQTTDLAMSEQRCLAAYAERALVGRLDLREMAMSEARGRLVWRLLAELPTEDLRSRGASLRLEYAGSPLGAGLRFFGAQGVEQEAQAAELQVRRWLLQGMRSIAVVVQDRLVARRVRAMLERAQVLVSDETGWTFSTLAASTVVMRWLETVQSDFYYQELLDLLKSPYIFCDQPASERKQAVYQLEQLLRRHGTASGLEHFLALAHDAPLVGTALARLRQAADKLKRRSDTLAGWQQSLFDSLDVLGVTTGLAADAAGSELLSALGQWRDELSEEGGRYTQIEWRHWLSQQLDGATFRDASVESPVVFTHLAATRWRSFDAVLLLGCDDKHLPGIPDSGRWFNDAVRRELGLPVAQDRLRHTRDDLLALLTLNRTILVTWQACRDGEPNLLSPWLELVRAQHELAWGDDLTDHDLAGLLGHAQVRPPREALPQPHGMPQPTVPGALLPSRISPSGYNTLVACPYQYLAKYVLRLDDLDEVREELDKRDYGTWVHEILQRFHAEYPRLAEVSRETLLAALERIGEQVFAQALQDDFLVHGWRSRWQSQQVSYLDWQLANEREGWSFSAAERGFELSVDDALTLHGRLDRLDVHADGRQRVLDYKTRSRTALGAVLKQPGEDVQLASYVAMSQSDDAAFVVLDDSKAGVSEVRPEQAMDELAADNLQRLRTVFQQMRDGAPIPANGADPVCGYCLMRGLCRKGYWERDDG
jgi:ATP-dependent helicase/nuclease subunit B